MSEDNLTNGVWKCPVKDDFKDQRQKFDMLFHEVNDMLVVLKQDQKHLQSIANSNFMISQTLVDIKANLLNAVLGKEIVPVSIVKGMIEEQRKSYVSIIKILCWVFSSIIIVIAGLKFLAPHLFQ